MQRPGDQPLAASEKLVDLQVEIRSGLTRLGRRPAWRFVEWNGCPLLASRCTLKRDLAFGNSTHVLS